MSQRESVCVHPSGGGAEQKPVSAAGVKPALLRLPWLLMMQLSQPMHGNDLQAASAAPQDLASAAAQGVGGGGAAASKPGRMRAIIRP